MYHPKISIITPIYNGEIYLKRCIESIISQTFTDFELILVNDGSSDCSGSICDMYAEIDHRIIVIHKENSGVSDSRNKGLDIASGEYIGFVDCDDYVESSMYESLYNTIRKYNTDLVICNYFINDNDNDNNNIVSHNLKNNMFLNTQYIQEVVINNIIKCQTPGYFCLWNKLFRRSIIKNINLRLLTNISFGEDLIFVVKYLLNINSISCIEKPLYYYCITETGLFSRYRRDVIFDIMQCKTLLYDWLSEYTKNVKCLYDLNFKYYSYICKYIIGIIKYEDRMVRRRLVYNALKNREVYQTIISITKIDKKNLLKYKLSRQNLVLPFLVKYRLYWFAYIYIQSHNNLI